MHFTYCTSVNMIWMMVPNIVSGMAVYMGPESSNKINEKRENGQAGYGHFILLNVFT